MEKTIDLRSIHNEQKCPIAKNCFDSIKKGEQLHLINDDDLRSLFYQFSSDKDGKFYWKYIESGPIIWKVNIKKI